ncbi:MAG TPA: hypothetical protein DCS46_21345, partial [Bradyrhizobium sp.]|nr:hypothetical protein [Bradyrhizobium sp.]
GGIEVRPTPAERAVANEQHFAPTPLQRKQVETASQDPSLFKRANNGVPAVAATARPGELKGPGVVHARPAGEAVPATAAKPAAGEPARPGAAAAAPAESHALPVPGKEIPPAQQNKPAAEERRATTAPETKLEPHPAAPAPAGSHALPAPEKGVAGHPPAEANKPAVEEKR